MQTDVKLPKGIRIIQIILGGIAIGLAFAVLVNPGLGVGVLIFLLSVTLLVVGFERIAMAFAKMLPKSVRVGNVVLGSLAIAAGIAVIVIASPLLGIFLLTFILGVNLLIIGIESISYAVGSHGFKTPTATNGKGKG